MNAQAINLMRVSFLMIILIIFGSCVSTPELPGWIERYPSDGKYFVGIGSSNTGNQSEDMNLARQDALANLAASISTTIVSEVELEAGKTREGEEFSSMRRRIDEKVFQTIEGAEVVDSFYSPRQGYWIYLRFSKEVLEQQKRRVAERVEESVMPVFSDSPPSYAESLGLLQKGHAILLESPYFASLRGKITGKERNLLDLLEEKTASLLSALNLMVSPAEIDGEAGNQTEVSIRFTADRETGRLPIEINGNGIALGTILSDVNGIADGTIDLSNLPLGRGTVVVSLALSELSLNPDQFFLTLPVPRKDISYRVRPLPLGLAVEYSNDLQVPGIDEMAAALFSASELPFSLAGEDRNPQYVLRCRLIVEDFPKYKENSLEISQARLIIQVEHEGDVLYAFESEAMKDGGLTISQAHERTVKKLFAKLKTEQPYLSKIIDALPITVAR